MDANIKERKLNDITHFAVRLVIGVIFIVAGYVKFDPNVAVFFVQGGIPAELQIPIALGETISGVLIIIGVLSRISASLLSIIMLGAIFYVKKAASFTGEMGVELDLLLLVASLTVITMGPGRISLSHIIKKIPRFLQ
ncbi:MAG: DoxX family protein [Nitrosopumilaceae archaeon]